jgi:DNA-damage-inducible protein D
VAQNTGHKPENLPQEKKLPEIKKDLKKYYREMKKKDK